MKRLVVLAALTLSVSSAFAGAELDRFKQAASVYLAEAEKQPGQLIKYEDRNGSVARSVWDTKKFSRVINELKDDPEAYSKLQRVINPLTPLAQQYLDEFQKSRGAYGVVVLDIMDQSFQMAVLVSDSLKNNPPSIDGNSQEDRLQKMMYETMREAPKLVIEMLDDFIQKNLFSEAELSFAQARLDKLKKIQEQRVK